MATTSKPKNIIGRRVAESRNRQEPPLTQDGLSGQLALIGIQLDRAAIAKIETNNRHVLDFEVKGIAQVLRVPVDWLLGISR